MTDKPNICHEGFRVETYKHAVHLGEMARYKRTGLAGTDLDEAIKRLKAGHDGCVAVLRSYRVGSLEYLAAQMAGDALRELADTISGEKDVLLARPHSTPSTGRNDER